MNLAYNALSNTIENNPVWTRSQS